MTEQEYDEIWAPRLLKLGREIRQAGSSVVITVDFEVEEGGRSSGSTIELRQGSAMETRLAAVLARSGANIDAFMMSVARAADAEGHSSMVLKLMGIPESPAGPQPDQRRRRHDVRI